jgi:ABC-type bacteriocin/lantibiotic exporter with double-glycine peptidase domain
MRLIHQTSAKSCNIACLMMILDHFGKAVDEKAIRKVLPRHSWGSSMEEMKGFLEKRGLVASLRNAPDDVMIASVNKAAFGKKPGRHYVVVEGLLVYDPLEPSSFLCTRELLEVAAAPDSRGNGGFLTIKEDLNHN